MDAVDLSFAEAEADPQFANIFITLRNLLMAAGDGDDGIVAAVTAMANFIREGAWPAASAKDGYKFLHSCWRNMINMIYGIPPNHPWHTIFVRAVNLLYELGDKPIFSSPNLAYFQWSCLYGLEYDFWDFWDNTSMRIWPSC
ncbi:hypothetical protein B0H67DRAFT_340680 [Lasiosphaeris hirsuta]|uniref:Uncharacterized protein n=1 Tax=Lasiosphaeris hirsuta TaxID=260670 RepID=A0AA40A3B2_9PEZI|nr:hypothetical protein B0H67DRAFT_340680 [Lasiosphaeris hirsuta]